MLKDDCPALSGPGRITSGKGATPHILGSATGQTPHPLDRGLPHCLDYKGSRFLSIDSLYLGMMVEKLGFPDKLHSVAKHKKLSTLVKVAVDCCGKAPPDAMTK